MERSLPEISPRGFANLDIALPALAEIRIALIGGRGNAKFHVPPSDLSRYHHGACRHSKPADQAATHRLFEVFERVCKNCAIVLPSGPDALWRASALAARRRERLDQALADRAPRTWLGYARAAARHDPADDEQLELLLELARRDAALTADAETLAGAWRQLAHDHQGFLDAYAADCPEVEAYNAARDAVRRSTGSPQRRELDQVSAAVGAISRAHKRLYGPPPELDVRALVCGVWLAARSRGRSARRAADLVLAAAGEELAGARVVDVTRLPPPRTGGGDYKDPAAWANGEFALWWPDAVAAMCARLEEDFEAEAADATTRLLLVYDWPLTCARDTPIAYLAAAPVVGPLVPYGYREYNNGASWSDGDKPGPSFAAVIAAPTHVVAKLEKEQAAQPSPYQPRFTAGAQVTGTSADLGAALELLRAAFPLLPGDGADEPPVVCRAVAEQRRARHAGSGLRLAGFEERLYQLADSLTGGYYCWVPDSPEEVEQLGKLTSWLRGSTLCVDVLCGTAEEAGSWASLFGTLESATADGLGFNPGGRHRTVYIPWHRIVALTGAPNRHRGHADPELWEPYEPVDAPPPQPPGPARARSAGLRIVPAPEGAT
ncbi:hypothetical protein [Kitasatospora sp. NPDC088783]|uniref:hypothetical protein n=1 Tax=Kitasatospora sp. NPDC088783 TaxID=3364077 RepID=UPI003827AE05